MNTLFMRRKHNMIFYQLPNDTKQNACLIVLYDGTVHDVQLLIKINIKELFL